MIIHHNRVSILGIFFTLGILSIGSTFAFFYTETNVKNYFSVKPYNAIAYENFQSPDNWIPSNVTDKKVFAKNLSDGKVIVRISYTEKWISNNGTELPNMLTYNHGKWLDSTGKDFSAMVSDTSSHNNGDTFEFAIKHLENTSDWVYSNDGYYYYQHILQKDNTSSCFLGSVEFNSNTNWNPIGVDSNGNYDESLYINGEYQGYFEDNIHTFSYISSSDGYANATYYLVITVEFADATSSAMKDIFNYDTNTKSGGAYNLYNTLIAEEGDI